MEYIGLVSINDDLVNYINISIDIPEINQGVAIIATQEIPATVKYLNLVVVGKTKISTFKAFLNGENLRSDNYNSFKLSLKPGINVVHIIETVGISIVDGFNNSTFLMAINIEGEGGNNDNGTPHDSFSKEEAEALFVAKVDGKQLTDENYTLIEKTAVENLPVFLSRDLTFEALVYASSMNISFDVLRPNKSIALSGIITINILNTEDGDSGLIAIKRGLSGNEVINLGGSIYDTLPVGSNVLFLLSYVNQGGNIIWNI